MLQQVQGNFKPAGSIIRERVLITNLFPPRHLLSPGHDQQRTLSELELFRQKHNLPDDGEFYTAIGPDGKKQIIMKLPGRV